MTLSSWTAKTKAQFDIYLLIASTFSPNGPLSSTESKLDIYKRRKPQKTINFPFLVPSLTQKFLGFSAF